jgi:ATP-dependent DNA ligase
MSVAYKQMFVMFPPRPSTSIKAEHIGDYPGWLAQRKFNGTRTTVFIDPAGDVHLRNRQREEHRAYKVTDEMIESCRALPLERGAWHVLDGELLHSKTKAIKDRVVLFDLLVHDSKYLLGTTYRDRLDLLDYSLGEPDEYEDESGHQLAFRVNGNLWLAETFTDEFERHFRELLALDEIEGLVLKDPGGKLTAGVTEKNNEGWQIRVRKEHKNYAF